MSLSRDKKLGNTNLKVVKLAVRWMFNDHFT